ncbi:MAG: cyclic pyranopterin monophosphate synthase MoaC [Deltaproteobacteria bacterium]|nr:cyclic pyranopterin monophosphate synthase MoaC [Candidatus Anaeroferrophillacea bacterium]
MVDVGAKPETFRVARAFGRVRLAAETVELLATGRVAKGDVLAAARVAGIMAAKRCGELIPLCHPLPLTAAGVDLVLRPAAADLVVIGEARVVGKTGVEMEAMTAVAVAALTVYDMCKAVDRGMSIGPVTLLEKSGGRSGHYINPAYGLPAGPGTTATLREGQIVRLLPPAADDCWRFVDDNGAILLAVSVAAVVGCSSWLAPSPLCLAGEAILVAEPVPGGGQGVVKFFVRRPGTVRSGELVALL